MDGLHSGRQAPPATRFELAGLGTIHAQGATLDGIGIGYVAASSPIAVALSIVNMTGTISDVLQVIQTVPGCGQENHPASCRSHRAKVVWHAPYVVCQTKQGALSNGKKQSTKARRTWSDGRIQQDEAQGIREGTR
jgi:hypothetical protein